MRALTFGQAVLVAAILSGCEPSEPSPDSESDPRGTDPVQATSPTAEPCVLVKFEGRTYRLTHRPKGAEPGVGRVLGEGRTRLCSEPGGELVTVYSVNEESPARAITISKMQTVWLYTRRVD